MSEAPFKLPLQDGGGWCEIHDSDGRLVADLAADDEELLNQTRGYIIAAVNEHPFFVQRHRDDSDMIQGLVEADKGLHAENARLAAQLAERDSHICIVGDEVEAVENALNTYCERLTDEVGRLQAALQGVKHRYVGGVGCWCDVPMIRGQMWEHSQPCLAARGVLEPKP